MTPTIFVLLAALALSTLSLLIGILALWDAYMSLNAKARILQARLTAAYTENAQLIRTNKLMVDLAAAEEEMDRLEVEDLIAEIDEMGDCR